MSAPVAVLFRKERDGRVIAVFPTERYANGDVTVFDPQEGHVSADWGWVLRKTQPATLSEATRLQRILESAPYRYNLKVMARSPGRR